MEEEEKIEGIVTSCRDCIFAEYEKNEQVGCGFDRLELFEEQGARIVGQDDSYKRYFLVVGRFCNACRNYDWGERHPTHEWHAIVAREMTVRCCFMIYADGDATGRDVGASLDSVLDQGPIQPYKVIILLNGHNTPASYYVKMLKKRCENIPWEVRDVVADDVGCPMDYGSAIDIGVQHISKATYYCVARAGYAWPPNYLTVFNHAINYDLIRVVALLPDEDGNGLLMSVMLHNRLLKGHKGKPLLEKLAEAADEEGTQHMIKKWGDLCV